MVMTTIQTVLFVKLPRLNVLSFQSDSDFAGRMMIGSCGPLSGFDVKKGRPTIIVFRVISVGGTASSKSNDLTNENNIAFILIFPRASVMSILPMRW